MYFKTSKPILVVLKVYNLSINEQNWAPFKDISSVVYCCHIYTDPLCCHFLLTLHNSPDGLKRTTRGMVEKRQRQKTGSEGEERVSVGL